MVLVLLLYPRGECRRTSATPKCIGNIPLHKFKVSSGKLVESMRKDKRPLTVTQQSAISLLVTGNTQEETARVLGISLSVISHWVNHHKAFKAELAACKRQQRPLNMTQAVDLVQRGRL
jgi:DNA invertase Pin-like site-specific DNA recombinase